MLFGKRGKSGLVALNLDLAQVAAFVKERLGKEVLFSLLLSFSAQLSARDYCLFFIYHILFPPLT